MSPHRAPLPLDTEFGRMTFHYSVPGAALFATEYEPGALESDDAIADVVYVSGLRVSRLAFFDEGAAS